MIVAKFNEEQPLVQVEDLGNGLSRLICNDNLVKSEVAENTSGSDSEQATRTEYQYDRYTCEEVLPNGVTDFSSWADYIKQKDADNFKKLIYEKVSESKSELSSWLSSNPMLFTDGKKYSVTMDKQSQLMGVLQSYTIVTSQGGTFNLTWNATGEECTHWEYDDLLKLSVAIYSYVKKRVTEQQYIETMIKSATSEDVFDSIIIDYTNCPYTSAE